MTSKKFALEGDTLRPLVSKSACDERVLTEVIHLRVPTILRGFVFTERRRTHDDYKDDDDDDKSGKIMEILTGNDTANESRMHFCNIYNLTSWYDCFCGDDIRPPG